MSQFPRTVPRPAGAPTSAAVGDDSRDTSTAGGEFLVELFARPAGGVMVDRSTPAGCGWSGTPAGQSSSRGPRTDRYVSAVFCSHCQMAFTMGYKATWEKGVNATWCWGTGWICLTQSALRNGCELRHWWKWRKGGSQHLMQDGTSFQPQLDHEAWLNLCTSIDQNLPVFVVQLL
jgi:hypothetical protein